MKRIGINVRRALTMALTGCLLAGALSACAGVSGGGKAGPTAEPTPEPEKIVDPGSVDLGVDAPIRTVLEEAGIKVSRKYFKKGNVIAVLVNKHYGFWSLAKCEVDNADANFTAVKVGDRFYTTAFFMANALCMRLSQDENGAELKIEDKLTLYFPVGENKMFVNGAEYPSYPAQKSGANIFIDCGTVAAYLGYETSYDADSGIYLIYPPEIEIDAAEQFALYKDRIELYETVVYNTADVECNTTGAGLYEPVPYEERQVGVAYTTWFRADTKWGEGKTWDVPLVGTYKSDDEAVIYQHGVWLANAGVDFVFVDWSNDVAYDPETMRNSRADFRMIEEATEKLFQIWATIPGAPKICIFTGPGHVQQQQDTIANGVMQKKNDQIYDTFIANEEYNKMYYYYEGKPLLICYGATPSFARSADEFPDDRFTVRWMTGYVGQQGILRDSETLVSTFHWSWEERGAQTFTVKDGRPEAMTVVASWRRQSKPGAAGYIPEGLRNNGDTFKMQWARADLIGPKFALIVSFNEWHLGEQVSFENSKDIEPSSKLGSLYLDILREQIRKFKGLT